MTRLLTILILLAASDRTAETYAPEAPAARARHAPGWVTGYWYSPPAWGNLPVSDIDFEALTHISHFGVLPTADGGFESSSLKYVTDYARELVRAAHAHGVKVLLCVAQTSSGGDFPHATSPAALPRLVANILRLVDTYGYDGVDLDWEHTVDSDRFKALVEELRLRLNALTPRGTLTGAFWEAQYVARVYPNFDQINLMAYDGCPVGNGFSWHNAALHSPAGPVKKPSGEWGLGKFLNAPSAIPRAKMGLGIPFYGYLWRGGAGTPTGGVTAPSQTWTRPPTTRPLSYREIVSDRQLWQDAYKRRDPVAGVPYLSIDRPGSADDVYVTYDDEVSVAAKAAYAEANGLGGLMIYDLSGDYLPGHKPLHPLLGAVKRATRGRAQAER